MGRDGTSMKEDLLYRTEQLICATRVRMLLKHLKINMVSIIQVS